MGSMRMTGIIILNKQAKTFIKYIGAALLSINLIACTGTSYVETADRMDVITLGDSIFDLNGEIQANLENWAGETFRNYTQSGAELSGGSLAAAVDAQYATAKATDSAIDTIVMDGGGNDLLIPATLFDPYGCRTHWWRWNISQSCMNLIVEQYVTLTNLLNEMDADGVNNIVYLGYYELPRGNANLGQTLKYGNDYLSYACDTATVANCTFVDPRGTIPANNVESDDIHPTVEGSLKLASQIWPVLEPLL